MRLLLVFFAAWPLAAAWNYTVISGASDGAMATRPVIVGDLLIDQTYAAYRDASGSLAIARFDGSAFVPATIWNGVAPSNTYASLNGNGRLVVTFWNNNRYRYALSVRSGTGNCGPASNYFCGTIPFPSGITSTSLERVVADVAPDGTLYVAYALRSATLNGLFYATRSPMGVWSTPYHMANIQSPNVTSPTAFSYTSGQAIGFITTLDDKRAELTWIAGQNQQDIPPMSPLPLWANSSREPEPRAFCTVHSDQATGKKKLSASRYIANPAHFYQDSTVHGTEKTYAPTNWCDIAAAGANNGALVYTDTRNIVFLARSPASGNWKTGGPWTIQVIDGHTDYARPQVAFTFLQKLRVFYHGPNFLKLAYEQ
jgi:hypothetical protein